MSALLVNQLIQALKENLSLYARNTPDGIIASGPEKEQRPTQGNSLNTGSPRLCVVVEKIRCLCGFGSDGRRLQAALLSSDSPRIGARPPKLRFQPTCQITAPNLGDHSS